MGEKPPNEKTVYTAFRGSSGGEREFWSDINGWMHMQAMQWEPAGDQLVAELGVGCGKRALDVGCGALGWLGILSRWVGPTGTVVGTEIAEANAQPARHTVRGEGLGNVEVVVDDVFHSALPDDSFDLVHARNMLGPLGRHEEQLAMFERVVKPGGWLVLEDILNLTSWSFNPSAPANERLRDLMVEYGTATFGRDQNMGARIRSFLRRYTANPVIRARMLVLPPGHGYRALPLMGATALRDGLRERYGGEEIDALFERAHQELDDPETWCTTYTMIQGYARVP